MLNTHSLRTCNGTCWRCFVTIVIDWYRKVESQVDQWDIFFRYAFWKCSRLRRFHAGGSCRRRCARLNAVDNDFGRHIHSLCETIAFFRLLLFRRSHLKMILLHDRLPGWFYGLVGLPPLISRRLFSLWSSYWFSSWSLRRATCNGFHYLTNVTFPHSGFGIPNTGGGSWYYRQIQRSRMLHGFGSMF